MPHKAYGYIHRQVKKQLLPYVDGKPCPKCGHPMYRTQKLDLDHSNPKDKIDGRPGDRLTHRTCNRGGHYQPDNANTNSLNTTREW